MTLPDEYHFPTNRYRIELDDPYVVRYWTLRFKCTEEKLREIVAEVGPVAHEVEAALGM